MGDYLWKVIQGNISEVLEDFDEDFFDGCIANPHLVDINFDQILEGDDSEVVQIWSEVARVTKPGANVFSFIDVERSDLLSLAMRLAGLCRIDSIAWQYGSYHHNNLEPFREDILVFRNQRESTYTDNAREHGVAGFNIDGARIEVSKNDRSEYGIDGDEGETCPEIYGDRDRVSYEQHNQGRWPTNTVLGHHPECEVKCHDDCAVKRMDESSGECYSGSAEHGLEDGKTSFWGSGENNVNHHPTGDAHGGASRFFKKTDSPQDERWNCHPDCAVRRMDESSGECKGWSDQHHNNFQVHQGNALNESSTERSGFHKGYNDNGGASRFFYTSNYSKHKPIDLCRWIATLIGMPARKNDKRKLIVPFSDCGAGIIIGAMISGYWDEVIGVNPRKKCCNIARNKIEQWEENEINIGNKKETNKVEDKKEQKEDKQNTLFDN